MTGGAIRFESVTLWRRTQEELGYDLKSVVFNVLRRRFKPPQKRRVLDQVSFSIDPGEKIGIIGGNGSGKSTILKLISGILRPTTGRIQVAGSVAPLIELGAGFDPDLSVEDNIIYNGILLGKNGHAMRSRIDPILDFAELQEHRRVPLKALSSGMAARLGFSIATDVRPDILLVDEVLSVGDESFRHRSTERLQKIWTEHATIVLVSHDIDFVASQCQRAIWVEAGAVRAVGASREVAARYLQDVAEREALTDQTVVVEGQGVGHVDIVRVENERLWIQGWALLPDLKRGARASVTVDGRILGDAVYGDPRPDVAQHYLNDDVLTAGFHADLPAAELTPGVHAVAVVVYDNTRDQYFPVPEAAVEVPSGALATIVR